MVSLAWAWRACGVRPAAVVGHCLGEIAAAYVAGGLSLADGARVVALWSQAQATLAGKGDMASVQSSREQLQPRLSRWGDRLVIAAINGPNWVAVSGAPEAVEELLRELAGEDVNARKIAVGVAAHSPQVDALRERLLVDLSPIAPHSSDVPLRSTLNGDLLDTGALDAGYWSRTCAARALRASHPQAAQKWTRYVHRGQSAPGVDRGLGGHPRFGGR